MSIARGSKSKLIYAIESAYGTAPTAQHYQGLSFSAETLAETINKIVSDEIRPDRTVPAVRGGNIGVGGNVTTDFAPARFVSWFEQLLACARVESTVGAAGLTPDITVAVLAGATYHRGDLALESTVGHGLYLCTQGGVVTGGDVTAGLPTGAGEYSLTNTKWQWICADSSLAHKYVLQAGTDYPTGGITIEKQLLGGSSDMIVNFTGGRLNTLGLTIQPEAIVKSEWGFLGLKSVKLGSTNSTGIDTITDDPFTSFDAFFSANNGQVGRPVREGSLNVTNNVATDVYAWGSRYRLDLPAARREFSGSITLYFQDSTEYDLFQQENVFASTISFAHQGSFLAFDFPETKITGVGTPQISGQGVITATYELSVFHQTGAYDGKVTIISPQNV